MLFGEIEEPSSRAFADDAESYPDYVSLDPELVGIDLSGKKINTLLFIDTDKIIKLFKTYVIPNQKPIAYIKDEPVEVYELPNEMVIVLINNLKTLCIGEVFTLFESALHNSLNIYTITSTSVNLHQNPEFFDSNDINIKSLTTDMNNHLEYSRLEGPDLISGFGANVFSYCIHSNIKCIMFVVYFDNCPVDAQYSKPVLDLARKIGFSVSKFDIDIPLVTNNLYI